MPENFWPTPLTSLTSNLDTKIPDLSRALASDPSLTAKVLKLSNSSFFGRAKGVKTLNEAIMILGFFTVRSMVVASSAHSLYNAGKREPAKAKLWKHSFAAAVATRQIAATVKSKDKEELFIAALLHDIGKLVLMLKLPARYSGVIATVEREGRSFAEVEEQELGFSHCDVGAILLEKWSFPSSIIEAVHGHHRLPERAEGEPSLACFIHLGNAMAKRLPDAFRDSAVEDLSTLASAQALGLRAEELEAISQRFLEQYQAEIGAFE